MLKYFDKKMTNKPKNEKEQISELYDAVFNHIPHCLNWLNLKMTFIFGILGIMLTVMGLTLAILVFHMG